MAKNKFLRGLAKGLNPAVNNFFAGQQMQRQNALQDEALRRQKIDNLTKQFESGLSESPEGGIGVNPDFLNPESDIYKRENRIAELKRLASPRAAGGASPLTAGQLTGLKAVLSGQAPLPDELKDLPVPSGYSNFFPAPKPPGAVLTNEQVYSHLGKPIPQGVDPSAAFPKDYLQLVKPVSPGSTFADPNQQAAYEQTMGLPPGSAKGLTMGQFTQGMSSVRGHQEQGKRQDKAINAASDRQDKALQQGDQHFAVTTDLQRENLSRQKQKDLEGQLEKFQGVYNKTGIANALPYLRALDESTGVLTRAKPDLSKLPGYGTNALRGVPLVGDSLATLAAKKYGGEKEFQALQSLMNTQLRVSSGTAVTKYEQGRQLAERGMGPGGNAQDVANGIKKMYEAMQEADRSTRAAYPPEVIDLYNQRGGQPSLEELFKQQAPDLNPSQKRAASAKKLNISDKQLQAIDNTPVKKQYSPSRNKTKLIYADGREEIVDGKK